MSIPTTNISFSAMANAISMALTNVKYSYFYKGSSYLTLFPLLSTTNTGSPLIISTFKSRSYVSYPGPPTIKSVTANGPFSVYIIVNAPSNNGGSDITKYTAVSSPDNVVCTSTSTYIPVSGLTCNRSYTFTVYATNIAGDSLSRSAASSAVTTIVLTAYYMFSAGAGGSLGSMMGGNCGGGGAGGLVYITKNNNSIVGPWANSGTNVSVNGGGAGFGGQGYGAGGGGGGYWIGMGYDPGGAGCSGCAYIIGPTSESFITSTTYNPSLTVFNAPCAGTYAILLMGGGGSGGGANSGIHGGGGAGYIGVYTINVNNGQTFSFNIGVGGANNSDGGMTSVNVPGVASYYVYGGQSGGSNNLGGSGSSAGGGAGPTYRHNGFSGGYSTSAAGFGSGMGTAAFNSAILYVRQSP